jgi:hypothetical protein
MSTNNPLRVRLAPLFILSLFWVTLGLPVFGQNLLPNPGFEEGADQPLGWRLADGRGGAWSTAPDQGGHGLKVSGDGKESSAWRTEKLRLRSGGLYRLRYFARSEPGTTGGCAVSGTGLVNRDFRLGESWQACSFVFSVPTGVSNDYVRLGQWEVKGALCFDDAELLPVQAVHHVLGEGESIRDGVYRFQPDFGWAGANYHRPLWRNGASFNSDRWVFSPGAELVYRFALEGQSQTRGQMRVGIGYYVSGALHVEASRDGRSWIPIARYDDRNRGGSTSLPASLFPAQEVFVRLSLPGPAGNLQVNACEYEAGLTGQPSPTEGATQFFDELLGSTNLAITLGPVNGIDSEGYLRLRASVRNQGPDEVALTTWVKSDRRAGEAVRQNLTPGQTREFNPGVPVFEPGFHTLTLQLEDAARQPLFIAQTEARLGLLSDPRPGYRVGADQEWTITWCESGWKIGPETMLHGSDAATPPTPVAVSAARGEFEAAQVVIRSGEAGTLYGVRASALRNARGERAPIQLSLHHVAHVHVTHPTDETCERGWYPDPLPPLTTPVPLVKDQNQVLWLTFEVPRETSPGDYTGELTLMVGRTQANGHDFKVPLAVHVYDFTLPRETHLKSALGLGTHEINRYHRLTNQADRVAVYEKYLKNFAEHRISPYSFFDYAPIDIAFAGRGTNKQARVDFTKFDRAAIRWLEENKFSSFSLPLRGMGGGTFQSRSLGSLEGFKEGTPEFARLFRDYLSQIEQHLRARGWLDKAFTYWFDEPDRKDYEFVVDGMKRIRAAAPGLRRMLTEQPESELMGHVEIWCGLTPEWTPEKVRARRAAGEEVWWYICCGPKAPYVTEFIDHPGTELRLWPWQSWQYGVQGLLIWATIYWSSGAAFPPPALQDPWADPMSYVSGYDFKAGHIGYWGNGDGRFLYPPRRDPNAPAAPCLDGPISSVRWENLRDGMEDYEYFWLLAQAVGQAEKRGADAGLLAEARALLKVPEAISKDLTHFTTDPRPILAHRDRLARMIERLQPGHGG